MRRFDRFHAAAAVMILVFSFLYFRDGDLGRAYTTLALAIVIGLPVLYRLLKRNKK